MVLPQNSLDATIASINIEIASIIAHHNAFLVSQKKSDAAACRGASIRLSRFSIALRKESMRIQKLVLLSSETKTSNASFAAKTVKKVVKSAKNDRLTKIYPKVKKAKKAIVAKKGKKK
jgi:hypothetical protein